MTELQEYASRLVSSAGKTLRSGEVLAKVLTTNDDSGRHGVLIPNDAYSFFPTLTIRDKSQNETTQFSAFDCVAGTSVTLAYKYYQRYPERRITRVNALINDRNNEPRIVIFLRAEHDDGTTGYYTDCANSGSSGRFQQLCSLIFGDEIDPQPGVFAIRPVDSLAFSADAALTEFLGLFDSINARGWVRSLRVGDTGIGYTFESLLGIKENNDKQADFKGIEVKCKGVKEGIRFAGGKINLFQQGPNWLIKGSSADRIKRIGSKDGDGLYRCHSQVTTKGNNLGLMLQSSDELQRIDLRKATDPLGYWPYTVLQKRLREKHSRAVIVKAAVRKTPAGDHFRYDELIYCERPTIDRFLTLVNARNIVFEFLMYEKSPGRVRNHGYPWRLVREEYLDNLFSFQVKLR